MSLGECRHSMREGLLDGLHQVDQLKGFVDDYGTKLCGSSVDLIVPKGRDENRGREEATYPLQSLHDLQARHVGHPNVGHEQVVFTSRAGLRRKLVQEIRPVAGLCHLKTSLFQCPDQETSHLLVVFGD